jgi:hypothetical protein
MSGACGRLHNMHHLTPNKEWPSPGSAKGNWPLGMQCVHMGTNYGCSGLCFLSITFITPVLPLQGLPGYNAGIHSGLPRAAGSAAARLLRLPCLLSRPEPVADAEHAGGRAVPAVRPAQADSRPGAHAGRHSEQRSATAACSRCMRARPLDAGQSAWVQMCLQAWYHRLSGSLPGRGRTTAGPASSTSA